MASPVIPRGLLTSKYAMAVELGMPLEALYDLTPRQIHEIYLHPRDETGAIKLPKSAATGPTDPRAILLGLLNRAPELRLKPEDVAKIKQRLVALDGHPAANP